MTAYILIAIALWLGLNAAFVALRLRAADARQRRAIGHGDFQGRRGFA